MRLPRIIILLGILLASVSAAFADKTILITGGSDGIGAEMARQLAARQQGGGALVLAGRSQEKLDAVAAQCRAHGRAGYLNLVKDGAGVVRRRRRSLGFSEL